MPEKIPAEQEALIQAAEVVKVKLAEGKRKAEIVKELIKQGWSEESAIRLVSSAAQTVEKHEKPLSEHRRETGKSLRSIFWGIPVAIIGFVIY